MEKDSHTLSAAYFIKYINEFSTILQRVGLMGLHLKVTIRSSSAVIP